jgi:hypothetical protein
MMNFKKLVIKLFVLVAVFLSGCAGNSGDVDLLDLFYDHRSEFCQLRDMILSESDFLSVGSDNVGHFWLHQGKWTTHLPPYTMYTESQMLELVGMSRERYETYLDVLNSVRGYRVTKSCNQCPQQIVVIYISRTGNVSSSQIKALVFTNADLAPVVDNLEDCELLDECYFFIEEGWYVWLQSH